ncbi:hypothetical protein HAX54_023399, partial [Datura stramonium]|nr:hypothetical protein [Datura stramonium]
MSELIEEGLWKSQLLQTTFPHDIVEHIKRDIHVEELVDYWDIPWWMATITGEFTINSAWNILRSKGVSNDVYINMWTRELP